MSWTTKRLTWTNGWAELPDIAIDSSDNLFIVLKDEDTHSFNEEIYFKKSTDGGMSWTTKRLTWNSGRSEHSALAVDSNDHIHIVWSDNTPGNSEVFYKKSTDSGNSWATKRLTWNANSSDFPTLALDSSGHIHVVWEDFVTSGNAEIYHKRSTDGGTTWDTKRLTWSPEHSRFPAVAVDSGNGIHVAYEDHTPGAAEIFHKGSTDGGMTWATKRLTWTTGQSYWPVLAIDGSNNFHIVWSEYPSSISEIYYKRSTDGGSTWTTKRLTWTPGYSYYPDIAVDSNGDIHLFWEDLTPGNGEIFFKKRTQ